MKFHLYHMGCENLSTIIPLVIVSFFKVKFIKSPLPDKFPTLSSLICNYARLSLNLKKKRTQHILGFMRVKDFTTLIFDFWKPSKVTFKSDQVIDFTLLGLFSKRVQKLNHGNTPCRYSWNLRGCPSIKSVLKDDYFVKKNPRWTCTGLPL